MFIAVLCFLGNIPASELLVPKRSVAGRLPKKHNTTFNTRRKFQVKKNKSTHQNHSNTHFSTSQPLCIQNNLSVTSVWENSLCSRMWGEGMSVSKESRSVLTLYPEIHRLACGLPSRISCQARVATTIVSRHTLQNQAVCAQDHPGRHILRYWNILQRRVTDNSTRSIYRTY